jgi:Fic family protein
MNRLFERSHPWISYRLDLRQADPVLWLNLGEAASKCEHLAGVPLRPSTASRLHQVYLAKGAAATTAIEGNTLSEEQVLQHIEGHLKLPPSMEYLRQEVDNVVRACNDIAAAIAGPDDDPHLCSNLLCGYNRQVLKGMDLNDDVIPGVFRTHSVLVGPYRGAPAEDCDWLMDRLCEWLNGTDFHPPQERYRVPFALLRAIMAHLYLAWIHPFGDGNGRTARLLEFHLLLSAGVPLPAAHLLSDHYNRTRMEYYRQLDRASKSGGDVLPFVQYAVQGFVEGLREQLQTVRAQQWQVSWENHVHEAFREERASENNKRRRDLVLDLSARDGFVDISAIRLLTPRLALAYSKVAERGLRLDLSELERLGLVERTHGRVRARREMILAFLPAKAKGRAL